VTFQVPRSGLFTGGVGEYENTDAGRNTHNVLRHGVVEEVDYPKRIFKARVGNPDDPTGSMLSGWIPFMAGRAFEDGSRTWDPPQVGEAVSLLCMSGELSDAVMLPGASYGLEGVPPVPMDERRPTLHRRRFKDGDGEETDIEYDREPGRLRAAWKNGTVIEYDKKAERLYLEVKGDIHIHATGEIKIIADGNMTLDAERIDLNPPSISGWAGEEIYDNLVKEVPSGKEYDWPPS
jgi:phage baseplate assembly protein gpV